MIPLCELEGMKVIFYTSSTLRKRKHKKAKKRKACEMKLRSGEKGGPPAVGWWWKVDSTMSEPGNNGSMWHFFLCVKDKNAKAD